jgi:putative ABC transport system substrate-binding protein
VKHTITQKGLIIVLLVIACWPCQALAQTVLVLKSKDLAAYDEAIVGFRSGLQGLELTYIELTNTDKMADTPPMFRESNPDLILCLGREALKSAISLKGIPKVFCLVEQPDKYIPPDSTNTFGVTIHIPVALQFRIMAQQLEGRKRIGVLYDPESNTDVIQEAEKSAADNGLDLVTYTIRSEKEVPTGLRYLRDKVDVLWSIPDGKAYGPETGRYALHFAVRNDIPFIGFSPQFAKAGALMAIYGDYKDMGRQCARIARMIFAGEKPHEVRRMPRKARIALNGKVVREMGIAFSPEFLKTVDKVF